MGFVSLPKRSSVVIHSTDSVRYSGQTFYVPPYFANRLKTATHVEVMYDNESGRGLIRPSTNAINPKLSISGVKEDTRRAFSSRPLARKLGVYGKTCSLPARWDDSLGGIVITRPDSK